jgi:hypothetical protein
LAGREERPPVKQGRELRTADPAQRFPSAGAELHPPAMVEI